MREEIYWHFRTRKSDYVTWGWVLLMIGLLVGFMIWIGAGNEKERERIRQWPLVEAVVEESRVSFVDHSSKGGFNGTYHIALQVSYEFEERKVRTEVFGEWDYRNAMGGLKQLEEGRRIKLRVNPEKRARASLIEITGRR